MTVDTSKDILGNELARVKAAGNNHRMAEALEKAIDVMTKQEAALDLAYKIMKQTERMFIEYDKGAYTTAAKFAEIITGKKQKEGWKI